MARASESLVFVDLDGTLILDNSFHLFLRSLWLHGDLRMRGQLIAAVALRSLHPKQGRLALKRRVLRTFESASPPREATIIADMLEKMRKTLSAPILRRVSTSIEVGHTVVMVTAAPGCYARPFARLLGLEHCLATPPTDTVDWYELAGEAKVDASHDWRKSHGKSPDALIEIMTDHADDLPLLRRATRATIQAAPVDFSRIIAELPEGLSVEHIDPISFQEDGGYWFWLDDAPVGPYSPWDSHTLLSKHRYALVYVGAGIWKRVRPGDRLDTAVRRADCPVPPSARTRLSIWAKRRLIRDRLGIFH